MVGDQNTERRAGMKGFDARLQELEHVVRDELGDVGEDGRLHERLGGIEDTMDKGFATLDKAIRGDNGAGLAERIRTVESRQRYIIGGLTTALSAVALAGWEWARSRLMGAG